MLKNKIKILAVLIFSVIGIACFSQNVSAQSINYRTYKYGTHQTSMADGYYARPAKISVDGDKYLVTMTIRTKKNLSPYPVKVLTIDGKRPLDVTKSRHGTDYDYSYSFETNNLNRIISSKISIDVPGVYKAVHNISFGFDTSHLPKLGHGASKAATKKTDHSDQSNSTSGDPADLVSQAQAQSDQAKKKEASLAKAQIAQNQRNQADNQHNQKMFYYTILGGVISLIILIVAAVFFVLSAKGTKTKKIKSKDK